MTLVFPHGCNDLVTTCGFEDGFEDVRVWDVNTRAELLRIRVPGLQCHRLAIAEETCPLIAMTLF